MPHDTVPPDLLALVCTRSAGDCNNLCVALNDVGARVLQVSDLSDAFHHAESDCFVLILLDVDLDSQWRSALTTLQQVAPGAVIIAYSHVPDERLWIDALEAGAFDFICTPINRRDLDWILENALKARADRLVRQPITAELGQASTPGCTRRVA